jgi:hypothetical protein
LLGGAAKFFSQSIFWLKNGYWQSYSILSLLRDLEIGVPSTPNLLGLQKIIDDVLSWPALILLAILAFTSLIVGSIFMALGEAHEWSIQRQTDERDRAQRSQEEQEDRREVAARSKRDFDFSKQVDDVVHHRNY